MLKKIVESLFAAWSWKSSHFVLAVLNKKESMWKFLQFNKVNKFEI